MKTAKEGKTKFIATVQEDKVAHIDKIAQSLKNDGVNVGKVSSLFGIISGKSNDSLEELKSKYEPRGLTIEPDRDVSL